MSMKTLFNKNERVTPKTFAIRLMHLELVNTLKLELWRNRATEHLTISEKEKVEKSIMREIEMFEKRHSKRIKK